ncbi:MAG: TetR family transcriptional regulator C-terminal domain-containing protein [Clostridia bacterium]|nr:TetR family transcriptional regulator C-terminal domain-containing protein [Clostridia bacterium]MBQ9925934.1 TetR family transcriptional regulator C-terminal domain-containing protein [Clostridia bacterium]
MGSVTAICREANVNRTTFYANYTDMHNLAEAVGRRLEQEVQNLYQNTKDRSYSSDNFLKLFQHIKENQLFYKTYFKLGFDNAEIIGYDLPLAADFYSDQHIEYHLAFFRSGLNAVIKRWLQNDCRESPEEIAAIIRTEYGPKEIL